MFPFSIFNWHYPFLTNLVQKIKIENLSWNLVFQLIRICRIQWWHSFYWTPCDSWKGPSILSSVLLSKRFLAIVLVFSEYWHSARNPYEVVCDWAEFSQKKIFCPKIWENGPKMGQKQGFLNLSKDLVFNFYWICSIMKTYIICCVLAQIPYFCSWENFCSWDMGQNVLSLTDCRIF